MYQKVLVPLDDSDDSRCVVKALSGLVAEDGEAILLHVISPAKTKGMGKFVVLSTQIEEDERSRALVHLNRLSRELSEASIKSAIVTQVSNSVARSIVNYASSEGVDLIAMYSHGRKGLAKLLKGSVTADVKQRTSVEVQASAPLSWPNSSPSRRSRVAGCRSVGIGDGYGVVQGKRASQGRDLGVDQRFRDFTLGSTVVAPGEGVMDRVGGRLTSLECVITICGIPEGAISSKVGLIWGIQELDTLSIWRSYKSLNT